MRLVHLVAPLSMAVLLCGCHAPESKPVAGEAAAPPAGPAPTTPPVPAQLRVVGTEPFWGIRIEHDRLHFTTAEDQVGKHLVAAPVTTGDSLRYAGQGGDGTGFELRLARGECSDGMSDRTYAYRASFRYDTTDYRGCADTAAALEAQPAP